MQHATILLTALTLVSASPLSINLPSSPAHGQGIDFAKVDAAPKPTIVSVPIIGTEQTVTIHTSSAVSAVAIAAVKDLLSLLNLKERSPLAEEGTLVKRDDYCSAQPAGTGPNFTNPDSVDAFIKYEFFAHTANSARTPDGYTAAFTNLQASTQTTSYLGYITLDSYDTDACVAYCNDLDGCQGVNIYFERDPSLDPNADSCPNPEFEVVITFHIIKRLQQIGSSTLPLGLHWPHRARWCHVRTPRPRDVQRHLHNLPILCIRQRLQRDPILQPRSLPEFCTVACASTSRFDVQNKLGVDGQGLPAVCNMVVAYVLSEADVPQGMYCAMYTQSWAEEYATNVGQWRQNDRGVEEWWAVSQAYAFVNSTYSALWDPICATGGCDGGSYQGGNYVLL